MEAVARTCSHCHVAFVPRRPWQRYCRRPCKQAAAFARRVQRAVDALSAVPAWVAALLAAGIACTTGAPPRTGDLGAESEAEAESESESEGMTQGCDPEDRSNAAHAVCCDECSACIEACPSEGVCIDDHARCERAGEEDFATCEETRGCSAAHSTCAERDVLCSQRYVKECLSCTVTGCQVPCREALCATACPALCVGSPCDDERQACLLPCYEAATAREPLCDTPFRECIDRVASCERLCEDTSVCRACLGG